LILLVVHGQILFELCGQILLRYLFLIRIYLKNELWQELIKSESLCCGENENNVLLWDNRPLYGPYKIEKLDIFLVKNRQIRISFTDTSIFVYLIILVQSKIHEIKLGDVYGEYHYMKNILSEWLLL
jgi:hypothetical protein